MTVNPDDLLIFKMRGMRSVQKTEEVSEAAAMQVKQKQRPAPKVKPERREYVAPQPEEEPKLISPYSEEDENRMRELETLEQKVALYANPPEGLETEQLSAKGKGEGETKNAFSAFAGVLFVVNAIVFGYFIYPQSVFVLNYAVQNGFSTLLLNWSYEYGTSFINLILALLSAISGIFMIGNVRRSHLLGGATGSMMLLAVSFEYLNSNATYLLMVSAVAFASVVALAYARMSAVSMTERESTEPQEVSWPRIETF